MVTISRFAADDGHTPLAILYSRRVQAILGVVVAEFLLFYYQG